MPTPTKVLALNKITLAVRDSKRMYEFYRLVLGAELKPLSTPAGTYYTGKLGPFELMLVPQDIAGIVAEDNRHQLGFVIESPENLDALIEQHGGSVLDELIGTDGATVVVARDPDGNSIELLIPQSSKELPGWMVPRRLIS